MRPVGIPAARRIALAAQGFGRPRPAGRVTMRQLMGMIDRIGLIQIDSVNVLARAHLMPLYSRVGPYDPELVERASRRRPRRLVEYWAHEASLIPPETRRLLAWRMARADREAWPSVRAAADRPDLLAALEAEVARSGPVTASGVAVHFAADGISGGDGWGWNWSPVKSGLEYLFWSGRITSAGRTPQFERLYDLPERVIPGLPEGWLDRILAGKDGHPDEHEAVTSLVRIAVRALGIGTARCFRDYFRLPARETNAAIARLVDGGELIAVETDAFGAQAYLDPGARRPRRIEGRALLSPFDPLVFERRRTEQLFGFRYRLEIYVPEGKRVHGYYVLPFLLNEALVARVDLKADNRTGCLLVRAAWVEPDAPAETAAELAAELELMAGWLGLDRIVVEPRGDLAGELAAVTG